MARKQSEPEQEASSPAPDTLGASYPSDFGEVLRVAAQRYFDAWPTQRDRLLASYRRGTERLLRDHQFESVVELREFLLEHGFHKRGQRTVVTKLVKARYVGESPKSRLASDELDELDLQTGESVFLEGSLISGQIPIALIEDVYRLYDAAPEELASWPPVSIITASAATGVTKATRRRGTAPDLVAYIAGAEEVVGAKGLAGDTLVLFDEIVKHSDDAFRNGDLAQLQSALVRSTYRRFALAYFESTSEASTSALSTKVPAALAVGHLEMDGPYLPMLTVTPVRTFLESTMKSTSRLEATRYTRLRNTRAPYYGNLEKTYVSIGDPQPTVQPLTFEEQNVAAKIALSLGDKHAQTFTFILASWIVANQGKPVRERVRIHVNDVLRHRERGKWNRAYKVESKRAEGAIFIELSNVFACVKEVIPARGRGRPKKEINSISRLIDMTIETDYQDYGEPLSLLREFPQDAVPFAFRCAPGEWINSYLDDVESLQFFLTKGLSYDVNELSEKIAFRLSLQIAFAPTMLRSIRIEQLLERIHVPVLKGQPRRTRDAVDIALGTLRDDGIITDYQYAAGIPRIEGKGWSEEWLRSTVRIFRAAEPRELKAVKSAGALRP